MISYRYAAAVCVLAVIALAPTIIHSYAGLVIDDGRKAALVATALAGHSSTPTDRSATSWAKRRFDSDDWMERTYRDGARNVLLTVIRSYDLKALYHHPELAVAYHEGHSFKAEATRRFAGHDAVPVHVLRAAPPDKATVMYVLEFDGRFVANPIPFQLRTAGELLFGGRKAMTLFFAQDASAPDDAQLPTAGITRVLFGAVDSFDSQSAR